MRDYRPDSGRNPEGHPSRIATVHTSGWLPQGRPLAFDLVVNHVPSLGPNGKPSQDPQDVAAAYTKFGTLEAITTRLYGSQRGP